MKKFYVFEIGKLVRGTRLTPLKFLVLPPEKGRNRAYLFRCKCGKKTVQPISSVRRRKIVSCGCARKELPQNTPFSRKRATAAFFEKVTRGAGCWIWNGCKNEDGYGSAAFMGKLDRAHRISWRIHVGEIPSLKSVLHRCDNPACVNPDHLFIGTQKDNMRDCSKKGRIRTGDRRGEKSAFSPFKNGDILEIRKEAAAGKQRTAIAVERGVCRQSIDAIVNRETWTHI